MIKKLVYASILTAVLIATPTMISHGDTVTDELSEEAQATLDRFEETGDTVNCVPIRNLRKIKALSDDLFLVRVGQNRYYLNRPTRTCKRANDYATSINFSVDGTPRLCKGEPVTVVSNRATGSTFTFGSCSLGEFVELQRKEVG